MIRSPTASLLAVAALALGACGGGDDDAADAPDSGHGVRGAATTSASSVQAAASGSVRLAAVGTFEAPVYVTAPPGDRRRIFVVEQGGTIRVVRGGRAQRRPFLDVRSRVIAGGEQGLLSMAFAPDYAKTRRFYVNYTDRSGVAARRRVPPLEAPTPSAPTRAAPGSCCATTRSSPTTTAA